MVPTAWNKQIGQIVHIYEAKFTAVPYDVRINGVVFAFRESSLAKICQTKAKRLLGKQNK